MPTVRVEGIGLVAFPDSMSPDEIRAIIRRKTQTDDRNKVLSDAGVSPLALPSWKPSAPPAPSDPAPSAPAAEMAAGVWSQVDPIAAIKSAASLVTDLPGTTRSVLQAQGALGQRAAQNFSQGNYAQGALTGLNYMLPLVGPQIQEIQDNLAKGDTAYGVGQSIGLPLALTAPAVIPRGARAGMGAISRTKAGQAVAGGLERRAAESLTDVMVPKVGGNKVRFGNKAAEAAPRLLREADVSAWSRRGLQSKIEEQFAEAEAALDLAHNQNPALARQVFNTPQIVRELKKARQRFVAETARKKGVPPAGQDVVPQPNLGEVAAIDQVIAELETLGGDAGLARYEGLRRIRESWDKPARVKYNPSMTQDLLKKQGESTGAAVSTGVLRDWLAKFSPETAKANQQYSLLRSANDVLQAAEEVERVRPSRRRAFEAAAGGATAFALTGDLVHTLTSAVLGPAIDAAVTSGYTTQIAVARLMDQLAVAIRAGNAAQQQGVIAKLARMTGRPIPLNVTLPQRPPTSVQLPVPAMAGQDRP